MSIKPEQVPDEAMNALLQALKLRKGGKEAIAAAISAWPGMWRLHQTDEDFIPPRNDIILPLPQEATNG